MKKLASWAAITAMALNALWPLIAQARPPLLVPVCAVGGETHYVEIPGGSQPADSHQDHCSFCFSGLSVLPTSSSVRNASEIAFQSPTVPGLSVRTFFVVEADARAPPVVPSVHSHNDNGRTNEEAFALRAARPDVGGGILRVGILFG